MKLNISKLLLKSVVTLAVTTSIVLTSTFSFAHSRFMFPSHTILSGDKVQSVSIISSISNDIFHPDRAFGDNGKGVVDPQLADLFKMLEADVITPEGKKETLSWQAFSRMSVADVRIEQTGTYRISLAQPEVLMTTFKHADGSPDRTFGLMNNIPEGATNIVKRSTSSRVETFVSWNEPNRKALAPTGLGLELGGETHPNDLFVGEEIKFQLFFKGKPVGAGVTAHFTQGGTRHRNQREVIEAVTDKEGKFTFEFKSAGFYLMEAEYSAKGDEDALVDVYNFGLYTTLEVFPQ